MSNYPPTPSFGGPFSLTSRLPPPTSVMLSNNYQQPSGPKTTTSHISPDIRTTLAANSYSFNGNNQVLHPAAFGSGLPPLPLMSLAHFPHGSLPPPPFPPVPIPQHGFPAQFSIPSQNGDLKSSVHNQAQQLNGPVVNSKRKDLHKPAPQGLYVMGLEGDREEGELSDRDIKATSANSTASQKNRHSRSRATELPPIPISNDRQGTRQPLSIVPAQGDALINFSNSCQLTGSLQIYLTHLAQIIHSKTLHPLRPHP